MSSISLIVSLPRECTRYSFREKREGGVGRKGKKIKDIEGVSTLSPFRWRVTSDDHTSDFSVCSQRRNDREEIRRRLAMGPDAEDLRAERGRKPSLQSRLQSGRYHSEYYHFFHDPVIVSLMNEISVIFRKVEASIYERKVIDRTKWNKFDVPFLEVYWWLDEWSCNEASEWFFGFRFSK